VVSAVVFVVPVVVIVITGVINIILLALVCSWLFGAVVKSVN
jgi:hypothetical protein